MYGLFRVDFDWHAFEELVAVSAVPKNLAVLCAKEGDGKPLLSEDESDDLIYKRDEKDHYVIREVREV